MTDEEKEVLKELRKTIDRWRRTVDTAACADRLERDATLDALDEEMGEVLHTKV